MRDVEAPYLTAASRFEPLHQQGAGGAETRVASKPNLGHGCPMDSPLEEPVFKRLRCRPVALALLSLAFFTAVCTAVAEPASAEWRCNPGSQKTWNWIHKDGVARIEININRQCSDGDVHVNGFLYDNLCDNRAAGAQFDLYGVFPYGHIRPPEVKAGGGCGTSVFFSVASGDPHARIVVGLHANNGGSGSDWDTRTSPV